MNELPTADELRDFMKRYNLTGGQAAHIIGVDSRTVRKWTGGERQIPYAAWRLLRIAMNELSMQTILDTMPQRDPRGRKLE